MIYSTLWSLTSKRLASVRQYRGKDAAISCYSKVGVMVLKLETIWQRHFPRQDLSGDRYAALPFKTTINRNKIITLFPDYLELVLIQSNSAVLLRLEVLWSLKQVHRIVPTYRQVRAPILLLLTRRKVPYGQTGARIYVPRTNAAWIPCLERA